jgi:beta-galactosidase
MMKIYSTIFLVVTLIVLFPVVTSAQQSRQTTSFDKGWKFAFGHAADPAKDFNFGIANIFAKTGKAEGTPMSLKFDDSGWRSLDVPHDWAVELPFVNSASFDVMAHGYKPVGGLFPETSIGWYRKTFTISATDSGKRFALTFDGVFRDAMFWLNGFYLGNNKSGYLGATYDITDYIQYGKPNLITVRVDATQYEGWFYEGAGIYRHVWLMEYESLHLDDGSLFVYSNPSNGKATVACEAAVVNESLQPMTATVRTTIAGREGIVLASSKETKVTVAAGSRQSVTQNLLLKNPRLWSLNDPYLYKVITEVVSNGKVIDRIVTRHGIRAVQMDAAKGMLLNGKQVKIKGLNNHQDHAGVGSAMPDFLQYYRIHRLKDLGANAYRCSHNAPTPELLDACDSLGMMVIDENRLLNSSDEYMKQWEQLILRDRSHASVFIWSIGNEEGYVQENSTGKRIAISLINKQKELDPTRTCTYAADLGNVFNGINEVIPVRGFNYRHKFLEAYHRDHPGQPVIGTEMGSTVTTRGIYVKDTIQCYVPDQDITAPWWASRAEEWWPLAATNDWMLGGFVWTGFDYRGEPTPYHWPNINSHFGIMDMCGFPKNIYYYYQSWWAEKDVLHISPHWNQVMDWRNLVKVWVNSNADSVELLLNGKSLGTKTMPRNSHLEWNVKYEPGTLEAVGYRKGKIIKARSETTGPAYELYIMPYKTTLKADGTDGTVINIRAVDKQGREVPDAMNRIQFKLSGDAKIIGVGNGDPSSHEPDKCADGLWQRSLFNGKCQLLLQAGTTPGVIQLEASSTGLYSASTEIHSVPVEDKSEAVKGEKVKVSGYPLTEKMLGADISFLPELEARGIHFSDKGTEKDAIAILKDHGFNYIRLRIFHNPTTEKGYSPQRGFCDLNHTLAMAKRIKQAGMKFLLDFHYSDYWADPQQQNKPEAWQNLPFSIMADSLQAFTAHVITALQQQGTPPDMVQIGNEINHGMVWPEGHIGNPGNLAMLISKGIQGVKQVDAGIPVMLHLALGGQVEECSSWLNAMTERGVDFDVLGLSYYPKWHGSFEDLKYNIAYLISHYNKPVCLAEYTMLKRDINDLIFNLPDNKGIGTCIWEPLNTWEAIFEKDGKSNALINVYDEIAGKFLKK